MTEHFEESSFEKIFHNCPDAIFLISGQKFVDCNEVAIKILRAKDREEVFNTHPSQLSPEFQPDGRTSFEKANDMISTAFKNGFHRFEWDHKRLDGEVFPVEVSLTLITFNGELTLHTLWKDLTEQKRTERKLEKHQFLLRTIYDSSSDAVMLLDEKGFFDCNGTTLKMFKVKSVEDFSKLHPSQLSPEFQVDGKTSMEKSNEMIGNAFKNGSHRFDWMHMTIDGVEFPAEVLLTSFKYEEKQILQATVRDITDRLKIVKELEIATKKAEVASRVKSDFLSNMSHEIRTPMNAIIGFTDLAIQGVPVNDTKTRGYLTKIKRSSSSLLGIINDILDFSKIEAGKMIIEKTPVDLEELIGEVVTMNALKAREKGLEFLLSYSFEIPNPVLADSLRLKQVLINLTTNAIKYTDEGEVLIAVKVLNINRISRVVSLEFIVKDSGIGLTQEHKERLFMPFEQADSSTTRKFGGTGLGLSISKKIVELMGGKIQVESELGKGSKFFFVIDAELQEASDKSRKGFLELPPDLKNLKALIIDDNASSREILENCLKTMKFRPSIASSAEEGIIMLRNATADDPFKLILTDWMMPGMDGIKASEIIKKDKAIHGNPKLILITAHLKDYAGEASALQFVDEVLEKPIFPSALHDLILKLFGKENYMKHTEIKDGSHDADEFKGAFAGKKILLAEDNIMNQQIALDFLENTLAEVSTAVNGQEALEILEKESFDLILMDLRMPIMDGYDASRRIRKNPKTKDIPIIALTAEATSVAIDECKVIGMNTHISKPYSQKILCSAILDNIGKNTISADAVTGKQPHTSGSKIKALLVEDNEMNQELAIELLSAENVKVSVAPNGQEALLFLATEKFDLIFMDINMPIMNGFETVKMIKETAELKVIPVIAMTAHNSQDEIRKCKEAGMDDYLPKPFAVEQLKAILQKYSGNFYSAKSMIIAQTKPIIFPESVQDYESESISPKKAIENLGGNKKLYFKTLAKFIATASSSLRETRTAFECSDFTAARTAAHTFKSNANWVGAYNTAQLSQKLESLFASGKVNDEMSKLMKELESSVKTLLDDITLIIKTYNPS
ncbi:MAG: response regulator [Lentisphaerota bacterium]